MHFPSDPKFSPEEIAVDFSDVIDHRDGEFKSRGQVNMERAENIFN